MTEQSRIITEEQWIEYQKLQNKLEFSKRVLQKIEELSCEDVICDIADHALFKLKEKAE